MSNLLQFQRRLQCPLWGRHIISHACWGIHGINSQEKNSLMLGTRTSNVAGWSPTGLRRSCPVHSGACLSLSILKKKPTKTQTVTRDLKLPHYHFFLQLCPVLWTLQPQPSPAVCPGASYPASSHLTFLICMLAQQWYVPPGLLRVN